LTPTEILHIKQDIRDLQKKLDSILDRLEQVEANTVPVDTSKDCTCKGEGPCEC
jgi:hypothetical protein